MLGALVLALNDDVRRDVRDANGRVSGIDVLAAGPGGAICIDAQVLIVNLYFDVFVDFGINKQRRKRSVTTRGLVKGRNTDEAVDAGFGRQEAVGVFTLHSEGHSFQSRFLPRLVVNDLCFEGSLLGPL